MAGLGVHLHLQRIPCFQVRPTFLRAHQAQHQPDHGGFALPGGPHQRHDLPRPGDEVRLTDHRRTAAVGKGQAGHTHLKTVGGKGVQRAAGRNMRLFFQLHQLPDTPGGHRAGQKGGNHPHQRIEGRGEFGALGEKERHGAVDDFSRPEEVQAVAKGRQLHRRAQQREDRFGLDGKEIVVQADLLEFALPAAEPHAAPLHKAKALDGVQIIKGLCFKGHEMASHLFHGLVVGPHPLEHPAGGKKQRRRTGQRNESHGHIVVENDKKGSEKGVEGNDQIGQPAHRVGGHRTHIAVEAVEDVAVGVAAQLQPVGVQHLVKDGSLNVVVHHQTDFGGNTGDQALEYQAEQRRTDHQGDHQPQLGGLITGDDINGVLTGHRRHQSQGGADHTQHHIDQHRPLVAPGIAKNPPPVLQHLAKGA